MKSEFLHEKLQRILTESAGFSDDDALKLADSVFTWDGDEIVDLIKRWKLDYVFVCSNHKNVLRHQIKLFYKDHPRPPTYIYYCPECKEKCEIDISGSFCPTCNIQDEHNIKEICYNCGSKQFLSKHHYIVVQPFLLQDEY